MATNLEQESTILRVKLDDLSISLKKLATALLRYETYGSRFFVEPQIINRLVSMSKRLRQLSIEEKDEGEVFASFLKDITDIIHSMGNMPQVQDAENYVERSVIVKSFKSFEEAVKDLLPVVRSIDEERKRMDYESFGGLFQKLVDAIEEKRFMIMRSSE